MAIRYIGAETVEHGDTWKMNAIRRLDAGTATTDDFATFDAINRWLNDLFKNAGIPPDIWDYLRNVVYFESNYLTNNLSKDYNLSSIRYINKPYQKNATASKVKGFAAFKTAQDWANDLKRVLSLDLKKKGRPIDAKNSQELFDRMAANTYFLPSEAANYAKGWAQWTRRQTKMYNGFLPTQQQQLIAMQTGGTTGVNWNGWNDIENKLQNIETYVKANPIRSAMIGVGIALTFKLLRNGKKSR